MRKQQKAVNSGSDITLIPDATIIDDLFSNDFDDKGMIPLKVLVAAILYPRSCSFNKINN